MTLQESANSNNNMSELLFLNTFYITQKSCLCSLSQWHWANFLTVVFADVCKEGGRGIRPDADKGEGGVKFARFMQTSFMDDPLLVLFVFFQIIATQYILTQFFFHLWLLVLQF